jgi:hypothetical protein
MTRSVPHDLRSLWSTGDPAGTQLHRSWKRDLPKKEAMEMPEYVECPANSVPVNVRQTGCQGRSKSRPVWRSKRELAVVLVLTQFLLVTRPLEFVHSGIRFD